MNTNSKKLNLGTLLAEKNEFRLSLLMVIVLVLFGVMKPVQFLSVRNFVSMMKQFPEFLDEWANDLICDHIDIHHHL